MTRLLLSTIFGLAVIAAHAQNEPISTEKFKTDVDYLQWFRDKVTESPIKKEFLIHPEINRLSFNPSKPGVYRLPQDGMPCIVPYTNDIAKMPNAYKGKVAVPFTGNAPHIPNASSDDIRMHEKKVITVSPNKK